MDDEKTKDYHEELDQIDEEDLEETENDEEETEENIEDTNNEEIEEDIEQNNDEEEVIKEVEEEKIEDEIEKKPKIHKKIILIIITILLLIACAVCVFIIIRDNKGENDKTPEISKIERPSSDEEYTILKQSYFSVVCKETSKGEKYKKLYKGLIIDCVFGYELNSNQKVSELYFDLGNSANVKLNNTKNNSDANILNEEKTYKITPKNPDSVLSDIHFYYEVLNDTDETGYVEITNIVFKDDNGKYYKVINSIETFPPEYDDKLYIYKDTYDDEDEEGQVYYYSSKVKYTDQELFDTFQCKSESCETKTESNTDFLIYDDDLILYNTIKKTSVTLKLKDDIKINDYSYELMLNPKGIVYGVAFKKNYTSAYDCTKNQYVCVNTGLSGYEIGYYSMALNTFTIDLDYGFIGSSAFNGYDVALMLKKGDQFGIFSYEDDNMMLELSDRYKSIEFDDETETIMLEVYDEENDNYYFEFYDPKYSQFKVDTDLLSQYENSNIYYTTAYNNEGISVTMLFDSNGKQIKNLPYVLSDKLIYVSDKIVVSDNNLYKVYDEKGNPLYISNYNPKNVLAYTASFIVATANNKIVLGDTKGKELANIKDITDSVSFVSAEEKEEGILTLIIKDTSITEENKNAYKYTIEINKPFVTETIYVE